MSTLSLFEVILSVFIIRALMSVPSHVLYSALWGYGSCQGEVHGPPHGKALVLRGFLLAILCHKLFNFLASWMPQAALAELLLVTVRWMVVLRKLSEGLKISPLWVR